MAVDLAWQIGSSAPPAVCLCCGSKFDDEKHRRRGPYLEMPYIWVCQWCWDKPYLFFPDKKAFAQTPGLTSPSTEIVPEEKERMGGSLALSIVPERTLRTRIAFKSVAKLKLDINNPRFRHLGRFDSEQEMDAALWKLQSTRTLYREIEYAEGLSNPILVDHTNVVREGNRRLVCLRKLISKIKSGESEVPLFKVKKVPCLVLSSNAKEEDIAMYLTQEHVTGKQEWLPVNQAAHVYDLHHMHGLSTFRISEIIGRSQSAVASMEKAYAATLRYHELYLNDDSWMSKYSYFFEAYRHRETSKWVNTDANLDKLIRWIHDGRITKGADIRKLHLVIRNWETHKLATKGELRKEDLRLISLASQTKEVIRVLGSAKGNRKLSKDTLLAAESLDSELRHLLQASKPRHRVKGRRRR